MLFTSMGPKTEKKKQSKHANAIGENRTKILKAQINAKCNANIFSIDLDPVLGGGSG